MARARLSRRWVLAGAVSAVIIGLTLASSHLARRQASETADARLATRSQFLTATIQDGLADCEHLLRSIAALFVASDSVEPEEWSAFLAQLSIDTRFPSVREVLYVEAPAPGAEGLAAAHSWRGGWGDLGPGRDLGPPLAGLAMRTASGAAAMRTASLPDGWNAMLCVPVPSATSPGSADPRGWLVAAIDVAALVEPFIDQYRPLLGVRVELGDGVRRVEFGDTGGGGPLARTSDMTFGGEMWKVTLFGAVAALTEGSSAALILAGGLGASAVVSLLLWTLARAQRQALALRRSEDRLQSALDSVTDYAMMMLDPAGRVVQCNAGVKAVLGYAPRELRGIHVSTLHPGAAGEGGAPGMLEKAGRTGRQTEEGWRVRKDGSRFWADTVVAALRDGEGRPHGFMKITRDMSERRLAQEQLAQHVRDLGRSNAELQQFAYVASHDLQEPLRMVGSYLQLLSRRYEGRLDADADEFIGFAVDGANRMKRLINDLLEFSRVDRKAGEIVHTDAAAALQDALTDLGPATSELGARVEAGPLPVVRADPVQLRQLFQNLVGNAVKFRAEAPPRVNISAEPGAEGWVFTVADNGIGIEPRYAERIFEVFQRLHSRDQYPGTGIGLAICRKIVERHGGRIWVEPIPGGGAAFKFTLPAAKEPDHAQRTAA